MTNETDSTSSVEGEVLVFRLEAAEKALASKTQWCNTMSLDFDAKLRTHRQIVAAKDELIAELTAANQDLMDRMKQMSVGDYWATRAGELASEVAQLTGRLKRIEAAVAGEGPDWLDDEDDDL